MSFQEGLGEGPASNPPNRPGSGGVSGDFDRFLRATHCCVGSCATGRFGGPCNCGYALNGDATRFPVVLEVVQGVSLRGLGLQVSTSAVCREVWL